MILHIFHDDKFIDGAIDIFEAVYPKQNLYIVVITEDDFNIKYIKKNIGKVIVTKYNSEKYNEIINNIRNYEAVIFHLLNGQKLKILQELPNGVNYVWSSWGSDIYDCLSTWKYNLYGKKTARLVARARSSNILKYYLRISFPFQVLKNIKAELKLKRIQKILTKVRYFSTVIPPEKEFVESIFKLTARYVKFNYFINLKDIEYYNKIFNENINNRNILLGNSASAANNHIEMLDILAKFNLEGSKIVVPLSYEVNPMYVDTVKIYGHSIIGNKFVPLESMLNQYEYHKLISTCSICIMNHYRQNAIGNIIFMLCLGSKVFLSINSPAYLYFKNIGIILFSIEKDLKTISNNSLFETLPIKVQEKNRKIIMEEFGLDAIIKKTSNFVNVITGKD